MKQASSTSLPIPNKTVHINTLSVFWRCFNPHPLSLPFEKKCLHVRIKLLPIKNVVEASISAGPWA